MLENILTLKKYSHKTKLTVKSIVAVSLVALAVLLPQIVHLAAGQAGGVTWLPMYLPVLLAGCLLGTSWGLAVGVASPLVSFALTSLWGSAMPASARLPFMIAELAVFAAVSGLFSKNIFKNGLFAFAATALAIVCGRAVFMLSVIIFQSVAPFTPALVWSQIQSGLAGAAAQAVLVPLVVMAVRRLMLKDNND